MVKPVLAVMFALCCAAAVVAQSGWFGVPGWVDRARVAAAGAGPQVPGNQGFAQVPAGNDAYGWHYPYAFPGAAPGTMGLGSNPPTARVTDRSGRLPRALGPLSQVIIPNP